MSFKGKSVVITGASGGIGCETARLFGERGANIIVNYFSSKEKAEQAVRMIQELGSEAFSFRADVSKPDEVKLKEKIAARDKLKKELNA